MWVTILFIGERDDPSRFAKVIAALNYCVAHDKRRNFRYEVQPDGEGIKVFSQNKNQAFKRGAYFEKKFKVNYNVVYEA